MNTVLFVLYLVLVGKNFAVWTIHNNVKSNNIFPIPVGISTSVAHSVTQGVKLALEHCQGAFKWDKWNCSISSYSWLSKQPPNREIAFAKAILAAGIVHGITKDCSKGMIEDCGCDSTLGLPSIKSSNSLKIIDKSVPYNSSTSGLRTHSTDWSWGECSDDPQYALDVTRRLLQDLEKGNDVASHVGRHNSNVGREMIRDSMKRKCRCHGTSGSCSVQTCWLQAAPFEEVSKQLRERYKKAKRLTYEGVEMSLTLSNSARDSSRKKVIPANKNTLVYLMQSPDYCVANLTTGILGTKGRRCSRNAGKSVGHEEKKSCRNLCRDCGHKVKTIHRQETVRCNCEFVWCCEVKCETCVVDVNEHYCY